jgi:hypothetical protein
MPPSLDFNWQEGDEGAEKSIDDVQSPATFSARPAAPQSRHSRQSSGPALWGYLLLLSAGVALGLVVGFVVLTAIGQYKARADFSPIVETEHRALAQGDRDLYTNLFDPEEQVRLEVLAGVFSISPQLYDIEDGPPTVSNVHLLGDHAEIEIQFKYDEQPYRRLENMRKVDGQWRFTRELFPVWGEFIVAEEKHVTVSYRKRDDFLSKHIPQIEATAQFFCERYRLPEPCQVDLDVQPDGGWLPFIPNDETLAISILSPRLVGVRENDPHPLWWLALSETIGETIARRALGPVTVPEEAANMVWTAVRGDVALQAEHLSGVTYQPDENGAVFAPDPATADEVPVFGDLAQRGAAMSFAHYLTERYGEAALVGFIHQARNALDFTKIDALNGLNPQQLSDAWQQWRERQ